MMRSHFLTNLAKFSRTHKPDRHFTAYPSACCNQQCRAYTQSRNIPRFSENLFRSGFRSFHRPYSSSSSNTANTRWVFLAWYLGMLESRPILTKSISSCLIYGAADVTSQIITVEEDGGWNVLRTMRMAAFGLVILGPAQHMWFNFVARVLPKRDFVTTVKKLLMGQLCFAPMITGSFFSFNAALQGENGNEITARLKRDLLPTLANGLLYWPLCDFLTYKIIPIHLQPLINSSFSYLWTIYLTYMASLTKAVPA